MTVVRENLPTFNKSVVVAVAYLELSELDTILHNIKHQAVSKVVVYARFDSPVSDDIKELLRTADLYGVDILDISPKGSQFKQCARWELRLIHMPTDAEQYFSAV